MTEARLVSAWDQTAMIYGIIHNVNCTKQTDIIRDFRVLNPYRPKQPKIRVPLKEMRAAWERRQLNG
jgi:hypothetical protein